MTRFVFSLSAILALFAPASSQAAEVQDIEKAVGPFLQKHCVECHDADVQKGDLRLDNLKMPDVAPATLPLWLTILGRVTEHEMPPPKAKNQPIDAERQSFVKPLEKMLILGKVEQIKREGRVVWRRLNRVEYENTLRDLFVLPHLRNIKEILPPDSSAHGFDNVSDAQDVTYVQMKRYLEAADYALSQASMIPLPSVSKVVRVNFADLDSFKMHYRFGDAPLILTERNRVDDQDYRLRFNGLNPIVGGEYRFRVRCRGGMVVLKAPKEGTRRDFNASGQKITLNQDVQRTLLPSPIQHVAAIRGLNDRLLPFFDVPKNFGVAEFTSYLYAREPLHFYVATAGSALSPHRIALDWIEIEGPLPRPPESAGVLFGDLITKGGEVVPRDPSGDARKLLAAFMERAFRRPIGSSEVQPYADLVAKQVAAGTSFKDALCLGYKAILCAPDFLFFREPVGPLDAYALANRLSYFLWRSMPDEELLETARNGSLITPSVLRSQAERMINDPRISRFVQDFSAQWLDLSKINDTFPGRELYPDYVNDRYLVESLRQETLHFLADMIASDMPAKSVVSTPIAWLNERLAIHYDLPGRENITGSTLRRVELPKESPRGGILTQGAILKVTADGDTTSPVIRGAWVLDRVLGTPPRPPPPGVGSINPDTRGATTIREQLAKHRNNPSCAACHSAIDPPGFALECFDVMGGMRTQYRVTRESRVKQEEVQILARSVKIKSGPVVDASGEFETASFKNIKDFRTLLDTKERQIARNLAERLVTVATGAGVNIADRAHIEMILNTSSKKGFGMRTMMQEIIASPLFLSK